MTSPGTKSSYPHPPQSLNSSEAEYVAMAHRAKIALFRKAVLDFLQPELASETNDLSQGSQEAENSFSGGRTKHIDVRYYFIRELVEREVLNIQYATNMQTF